MEVLLNIFQVLVVVNGLLIFVARNSYSGKYRFGMLIAGITLILSSIASYNINAWYPLIIGYVLLFIYRLLKFEPINS